MYICMHVFGASTLLRCTYLFGKEGKVGRPRGGAVRRILGGGRSSLAHISVCRILLVGTIACKPSITAVY